MGHYKGIQGFPIARIFGISALLIAAGLSACAQQPERAATYRIEVPAESMEMAPPVTTALPPDSLSPVAARLRTDAPLRYVVKKGDTLWHIANRFLLDAWQWPEIWYVNDKIQNPHLIYPGDVLSLIYINGAPRLISGDNPVPDNVVRLSPRTREEQLRDAIPAIPIEAIRDFLASPRVVTADELSRSAYLVAFLDPQLVGGAGAKAYVKNLKPGVANTYAVVRMGEILRDPETNELLGYEAIPVGAAEVVETTDSLATIRLLRTTREARAGDRLLPLEADTFDAYFYPKAPSVKINGRIISVLDGVSEITQYQVVTLNRGVRDGLERGDVLSILQAGRTTRDPYDTSPEKLIKLPDLFAGSVLVFKLAPRVSYALVLNNTRAIHRLDKVENPRLTVQ